MDSGGRTDAEAAGHLDLERARELFEASTDFTIGARGGVRDRRPRDASSCAHRFEDLYAACLQDELLAESAAGELIASEIEIRSGRAESFAEAMELQREHRARLFALAEGMGLALAATGTHPWAELPGPADHRHAPLRAASRGAPLGGAAKQHLEPSRPRGRARRRSRGRRLRPPARRAARRCWRCRRTRRSSMAATPACTRCAPRSSPAPSRAAGSTSRSGAGTPTRDFIDAPGPHRLDRRGDPALVERPPPPRLRHRRGADLRRADAGRGVVRARGPDHRLRRAERARLRRGPAPRAAGPARDRGEPLARDPPRDGRQDDRLRPRRGDRRPARRSSGCSSGPRRPASPWASTSRCRS